MRVYRAAPEDVPALENGALRLSLTPAGEARVWCVRPGRYALRARAWPAGLRLAPPDPAAGRGASAKGVL